MSTSSVVWSQLSKLQLPMAPFCSDVFGIVLIARFLTQESKPGHCKAIVLSLGTLEAMITRGLVTAF